MVATRSKSAPVSATKKTKHTKQAKASKPKGPSLTKEEQLANYSFNEPNQVKVTANGHKITLKCKIAGIPRPQYRTFSKSNNNPDSARKVNVYNVSNYHRDSFANAINKALEHRGMPFVWFPKGSPVQPDPMELRLWLYFTRPKNHYSYDRITGQYFLKRDAPVYVTKTPDIDNCVKLVMDAMQSVLFEDDRCIVSVAAKQLWLQRSRDGPYKHGQEKHGCTIFELTQYKENTSMAGCHCSICMA